MGKPRKGKKARAYFVYRSALTGRFICRLDATPETKREWVRERRKAQA